jgi:hypothetical protein
MKPRILTLGVLAAWLCACATSSVKGTWKSPDGHGPVGKLAVLVIAERGSLREAFENRFVAELGRTGSSALTTFDLLPLSQIKQDKRAAADRLSAGGAEAILILRLVDKGNAYGEVGPGRERYAAVPAGDPTLGWFDYYSIGFMDLSPTYGSLTEWAFLEASLHDLKTEKRIWSGLTRTVLKEDMNRLAAMDQLVGKIVAAMRKDQLVR